MRFPTPGSFSFITYLIIVALTFHVLAGPRPDVTFEGTLTLSYEDMPNTSTIQTASATTPINIQPAKHKCATGSKGTPPLCNGRV